MKRFKISLLLFCIFPALLRADVAFTIAAETLAFLNEGVWSPIPQNSLIVFIADTSGAGFEIQSPSTISVGSLLDNSDLFVIWKGDLAGGDSGAFFDLIKGDPVAGNTPGVWNFGDPVAIYWFPGLTPEANSIEAGQSYGYYHSSTGLDGSAEWVTPQDGWTVDLRFFTENATILYNGGSNPNSAGYANLQVVPEPSVYAGLLGGMVLLLALSRRRSA